MSATPGVAAFDAEGDAARLAPAPPAVPSRRLQVKISLSAGRMV
jgi:hypothetical protein